MRDPRARILQRPADLLEQRTRELARILRRHDLHDHVEVARGLAARRRHALAGNAHLLAARRARRDLERHAASGRKRRVDRRAQRRLDDRQRQVVGEVAVLAREPRVGVRVHAHHDVEPAGHREHLVVVDADRDLHLVVLAVDREAMLAALEHAFERHRELVGRVRLRTGARAGTAASLAAAGASAATEHVAEDRLEGLAVRARPLLGRSALPARAAEWSTAAEWPARTERPRARTRTSRTRTAGERLGRPADPDEIVVALALLVVREHLVGLLDLGESRDGRLLLVAVGVVLQRELAVGAADLVRGRRPIHAQGLVVVAHSHERRV